MIRTAKIESAHEVMVNGLKSRLRALDLRIARMRALHAGSVDPLPGRLIKHSLLERDEIAAKLSRVQAKPSSPAAAPEQF